MDPVSIFIALYDTKCLKFGQFELKSGLVAPYYINLRRLSLYPKLMDSILSQVVDRFLSQSAIAAETRRPSRAESAGSNSIQIFGEVAAQIQEELSKKLAVATTESDADSQLDDIDPEMMDTEPDATSECADYEKLAPEMDPIICGVPNGAIPWASTLAHMVRLPFLFQRKDTKSYGDLQCLMADFNEQTRSASDECQASAGTAQRRVILVEDVISSGQSILDTVRELEKLNLKVEFVICIVDREENGAKLVLEAANIRVVSLYKISAILRILETTGRITTEQYLKTREWMDNNKFTSSRASSPNKQTISPSATTTLLTTSTNIPACKLPAKSTSAKPSTPSVDALTIQVAAS